MEKLLEIARKILEANNDAYLSGSLALRLQGFETRREPEDIDIWIPGAIFKIPGMKNHSSSDMYDENSHIRETFIIDGITVDFFSPIEDQEFVPATTFNKGMRLVSVEEILKFKIEHAMDTNYEEGREKHLKDLLFILENEVNNLNSEPIIIF